MSILSFFIKDQGTDRVAINGLVKPAVATPASGNDSGVEWYADEYEGQLAVDVYQTAGNVVIRSTIAGVRAEDLDITLNNDVVTIRGRRYQEVEIPPEDYFCQECYWGGFSRSIVLPVEVDPEKVEAGLKNGVLTVKLFKEKARSVAVKIQSTNE